MLRNIFSIIFLPVRVVVVINLQNDIIAGPILCALDIITACINHGTM